MPKTAYLAKHFSSYELKKKYLLPSKLSRNEKMASTVENLFGMDY